MSLVKNETACQQNAISNIVHAAKYNSSLRDCLLLVMELWTNPHSSQLMKKMYLNMASMVLIPASKWFSWEEMAT